MLAIVSLPALAQAFDEPTDKINDPVKSIEKDTVLPARYDGVTFMRVVDEPATVIGGTEVIDVMIEYPEVALRAEMEATVYVDVYIDSLGYVAAAKLVDGGVQGFNHAAINAVHKLQFVPANEDDNAVNSISTLPIKFNLPEDKEIPEQLREKE